MELKFYKCKHCGNPDEPGRGEYLSKKFTIVD